MAEISVTLKVMPEGKETDLEKIKEEIKSRLDPHSIEEEEVAFGLKSLNVKKVIPDDSGGTDEIEEAILEIDDVKDVRVIDQRKLL